MIAKMKQFHAMKGYLVNAKEMKMDSMQKSHEPGQNKCAICPGAVCLGSSLAAVWRLRVGWWTLKEPVPSLRLVFNRDKSNSTVH